MTAHFTFGADNPLSARVPAAALTAATLHFEDGTEHPASPELTAALACAITGIHNGATVHLAVDDDVVTADRAAGLLGVSRPTIYFWQDQGRLGRVQVGSRRMVPLADVLSLKDCRAESTAWARELVADIRATEDPQTDLDDAVAYLNQTGIAESTTIATT